MAILPSMARQRRLFRAAVAVAVLAAISFTVLLEPGMSEVVRTTASGFGLLVAGLFVAAGTAFRAWCSTGRRRRAWALLLCAGLVAVVGNVWVAAIGGADPVSSPSAVSDTSIALALTLSIVALLNFPTARRSGLDLIVLGLDGLVMGAAVLMIASALVYTELLDSTNASSASGFTSLLIPFLDVLLATVALLIVRRTRGIDRRALGMLALGFILYAVTDLAFAVLVAQGSFEFGSRLDLGWIAGYLVIGLAAWFPTVASDDAALDEVATSQALDTAVVFAVLLVAVLVQVVFDDGTQLRGIQAVLWLVLIVGAGARQTLLTHDNTLLRRGLEQRVREQTADLRQMARETEVLLTSVGDGIYGVDLAGRITFVNPSGAAALGSTPEELLGRVAHDVFHAPMEDGTPYPDEGCYIAMAIEARAIASAEEDVYLRADGVAFPVEITASPLVDEDSDTTRGAVVVFRDVTQRREVDRMKNEFLSVVSHELRTPLTSIRGSLGLLVGGTLGELTPRAASMAGLALESTERLTRMINDILDLERIESGNQPLDLTSCEAESLVTGAVQEMAGLARTSAVAVVVGSCPGRVVVDRDRIIQTLTNLIGNAVKFSERGGTVVVDSLAEGSQVVFRVRDEGRGIPAERLDAVFERFEQVDSSDARQKGGTGLGLAISRGIVERHGGRIWAESELGAGTTVFVSLTSARPLPVVGAPDVSAAPMILVCDDDPTTVAAFCDVLTRHGYVAVGVSDGAEAVARMTADRPAALLLDLLMPGTTGAQVVAELKAHQRTRDIPVIIVSGMGPQAGSALPGVISDWLVKPVSEDRLLATVRHALEDRLRDGVVLLVEDDLELGGVVTSLLSGHGLRVVHAQTAQEAIRLARTLRPRVVVLDLVLPDGDGYEVVTEFRDNLGLGDVALVVYSAVDVEPTRRTELQLGPTLFLTKGRADPEVLEDRVLELVHAITGKRLEGTREGTGRAHGGART